MEKRSQNPAPKDGLSSPLSNLIANLASSDSVKTRTLARGDFLLQAGELERNLYLVEEGAIRVFYLTEIEEHSIRFGYKGSLIGSIQSFINETPSELYIQAIRKTTLKQIPKSVFEETTNKDEESRKQYIGLMQQLITQVLEREIDLLTQSPIERYNRVFQRSPQLFQEIPAKYIASYLRMTPETLSRIRKN